MIYVVGLSLVPLIHETLSAQSRWLGYGTGAYQFQNDNYFVLLNDPYDGSSKPHIHVIPSFAPAARISLLEFSDWTSWVDEHNLFDEFNVTLRENRENPRQLDVTYSRPDMVVYKYVEVSSESVKVVLKSEKEFKAHLEMWRWVMSSINGISITDTNKPVVVAPTTLIEFTFEDERLRSSGHGRIALSAPSGEIKIYPHEKGFNKISIDVVNTIFSFTVSGSIEKAGASYTWNYALLPYVLPIVAVLVVTGYLLVGRYGRALKNLGARRSS